jgi:hypothetical protein
MMERAVTLQRFRFTIRTLVVAIMAVGILVAMLRRWNDFLFFFFLILVPLAGLLGLWSRVPEERPSWRRWISAAMLGLVILGGGWLWARCVIWQFQRQEGFVAIGGAGRGAYYEFWGSTVPECVTGICLLVYALFRVVVCAPKRRRPFLPVAVLYALGLAAAYIWFFASLEFEAFD